MSERNIEVRRLLAADAAALSACFERCYGNTYPADVFYDVAALAQRIASGELRSAVAIDHTANLLVGHTGLTVRHPGSLAVEAGNTVVDPNYRGQGLLGRLGAELGALCREHSYVAYLHYPTTAHEIMQKSSVRSGFETGVMLDYIPAETDYRSVDRRLGRLAATIVYQPFRAAPRRVVGVPARYLDPVREAYRRVGLQRHIETAAATRAKPEASVVEHGYQPRRRLAHLHVSRCGRDLATVLRRLDERDAAVTHLDLTLDDPAIADACDVAVELGFYFCGVLPEFATTDVLRLQRLTQPGDDAFAPALVNADARRLLEFMSAEAGVL